MSSVLPQRNVGSGWVVHVLKRAPSQERPAHRVIEGRQLPEQRAQVAHGEWPRVRVRAAQVCDEPRQCGVGARALGARRATLAEVARVWHKLKEFQAQE